MTDEQDEHARRDRFERLFDLHFGELTRFARRRVDVDSAGDVVSETFLIAWRRLDEIPEGAARPWLYGVARNVMNGTQRSRRRQQAVAVRAAADGAASERGTDDPAEPIVERLRVAQVLAALSVTDREVLQLSAWEQLNPAEIAQVVGCTRAAAKVRLHRARRHFATAMAAAESRAAPRHSSEPREPEEGELHDRRPAQVPPTTA